MRRGDSNLRKLRVSDGTVLWKIFAGGWPDVSGPDLTPDGAWLVAGTYSLDAIPAATAAGGRFTVLPANDNGTTGTVFAARNDREIPG